MSLKLLAKEILLGCPDTSPRTELYIPGEISRERRGFREIGRAHV